MYKKWLFAFNKTFSTISSSDLKSFEIKDIFITGTKK